MNDLLPDLDGDMENNDGWLEMKILVLRGKGR